MSSAFTYCSKTASVAYTSANTCIYIIVRIDATTGAKDIATQTTQTMLCCWKLTQPLKLGTLVTLLGSLSLCGIGVGAGTCRTRDS
eukprot:1142707-Pelagomonas_calceolata.AAC.3